jgi:hypothetical protein
VHQVGFIYTISNPSSFVQPFLNRTESNSNRKHYKSIAMNEITFVLLIMYGMTSLPLRLCMNELLQSAMLQELTISHSTRTVLLTGGGAGRPGRERLRDKYAHISKWALQIDSIMRQICFA